MNGRCEAIVQHIKAAIRRTLHGAEAPFDCWPIAARFINEKLRQKQVDKEKKTPPFWSERGFGDHENWSQHRRRLPTYVPLGFIMGIGLKGQMELRR